MKKALNRILGRSGQLAQTPIKEPDVPGQLIIPLAQNAGESCSPAVEAGAPVLAGQMIGRSSDPATAHILAPLSGRVTRIIDKHPTAFGGFSKALVIEPGDAEGEKPALKTEENFLFADRDAIWAQIEAAGVVCGGPGAMPLKNLAAPALKLKNHVDKLLVLGFDAEPMLCGDRRAASQFTADLGWGIAMLKHLLGGPDATLLVHGDDYKNIMRTLREFSGIDLVDSAPELYPDNLPELLVKKYFKREVPMNGTAADVDVVVVRAETVVAALHAVRDGKPHTHKIVTVTGPGVYWPRLLNVPIGMTIGDVVAACGGLKTGVEYLVVGGPLRGWANYDKNVPVTHETDAVIALPNGSGKLPVETPCINCGDCVQACPVNLQPNLLSRFCEFNQYEGAAAAGLDACVECGMCGYVCPALRPMLQFLRTAKHEIAETARKQAELDALAAAEPVPQEPDAQPEAFKPGAEAVAAATADAAPAEPKPEEKTQEKTEDTPAEPAADAPAADAGEQKTDGEKTPES